MSAVARGPSLRERQRQERERLILQAAQELLAERGYHEMSIDEIAARVGISKGTIYLHFASKEELVVALFERGVQHFARTIEEILSQPGSPRARLEAVLRRVYAGMDRRHRQWFAFMRQDPAVSARLAERHCSFESLWSEPMRRVAAVLEEGKASGEFDSAMPTAIMVRLFGSLMVPVADERLLAEGFTTDDVAEHLIRFFFQGIAPSPAHAPTTSSHENGVSAQ